MGRTVKPQQDSFMYQAQTFLRTLIPSDFPVNTRLYGTRAAKKKESNERKTGTFDIPSDGTDGRDLVSQSHGQIVDICRVSCTLVNYPQANYCGSIIKTSQLAHLSKRYFLTQLVLQAHSCHAEEALLCSLTPIYLQNMVHRWCRRCYNKARLGLETALLPLCLKLS